MQLIRKITDHEILGGPIKLIEPVSRFASRGVLIDGALNVAMMYMSKLDLYKLPGGGIEEKETKKQSFLREILEETGYEAEATYELGYIEEHKAKHNFLQISYCWIATVRKRIFTLNLSESEKQLGMTVIWMTLDKALEVMSESLIHCNEYSTKFMILRDKTILEIAYEIITKSEKNIWGNSKKA